jgi:hypothetical protein
MGAIVALQRVRRRIHPERQEECVLVSSEEAAVLAEQIGRARGLRPGQLPDGEQFAEGLNGMEECAAFIERVGQARAPFPLPKYVPLLVIEPTPSGDHG